MPRLGFLIACVALVGTACGAGAPSDDARASSRASSTTSPNVAPATTSTTTPSTTSSPPVDTTTTTAPPATTSPDPVPDSAPALASGANGQLSDARLTTFTPSCRILNELAPRLRSLLDAAHADGVALWPETQPYTTGPTPPHLTSCYREFEIQQWWRDYYCGEGSCGMAAVPGTSVHGWGRAVDFEQGGQELAFDMPGYQWLVAHASTFGFFQPGWAGPSGGAPEPWHWEAS